MEVEEYNLIEIKENDGIGEIRIDNIKIKAISNYEIKRGTDIVTLTVSISVPPKKFKTITPKY